MNFQNSGITIKLKPKVDILSKLIKTDEFQKDMTKTFSKSSLSGNKSVNLRNSKISSNEYDSLPAYEQLMSKLTVEEKDDINQYFKSLNHSTLNSILNIINSKKLYTRLKTKQGLEVIKTLYKENLKYVTDGAFIRDDCELYFLLKDQFNISELQCMDIFDIFKFNEFFAFTEQCYILFVYLIAAMECGYLSDYFNNFSEDLFLILSGGENIVTVNRIKEIGRILDINERLLASYMKDIKFENNIVEVSKFKEFYQNMCKMYDEYELTTGGNFKDRSINANELSSKRMQKNPNCMNKACNIL
jgi:hypothetical protein